MSNIYSLEPQAFGLIIFKTTFGELELELFTKQCPKITKNFVQLCLDGYYNNTVFDRVEKDFIAIGGKLKVECPFEIESASDEFHSRLKFSRRGLVATANEDKDANGPEFFFTLGPAPELQNKHSIFGRLRGDSIYHLVDLNECPVDEDLLPVSEKKILETIIETNPFPELEPRPSIADKLRRLRGDFNDQLDDLQSSDYLEPKLEIKSSSKKLSFYQDDSEEDDDAEGDKDGDRKTTTEPEETPYQEHHKFKKPDNSGLASVSDGPLRNPTEEARQKKLREVREKFEQIKRQIELDSATKMRSHPQRRRSQDRDNSTNESINSSSSKQFVVEDSDLSNQELRLAPKKGRLRERETLAFMENFRKKLKQQVDRNKGKQSTTDTQMNVSADTHGDEDSELVQDLELVDDDSWLRHKFDATDGLSRAAKDANTKGDDWYSIDDPRNPIVQRVEAERAREYSKHRRRDDRHAEDSRASSRSLPNDSRHRRSGSGSSRDHRR